MAWAGKAQGPASVNTPGELFLLLPAALHWTSAILTNQEFPEHAWPSPASKSLTLTLSRSGTPFTLWRPGYILPVSSSGYVPCPGHPGWPQSVPLSVGRVLDDLAMHITTGKLLEALGFTDSTELSLTMHHALLQSGVAMITIISFCR